MTWANVMIPTALIAAAGGFTKITYGRAKPGGQFDLAKLTDARWFNCSCTGMIGRCVTPGGFWRSGRPQEN